MKIKCSLIAFLLMFVMVVWVRAVDTEYYVNDFGFCIVKIGQQKWLICEDQGIRFEKDGEEYDGTVYDIREQNCNGKKRIAIDVRYVNEDKQTDTCGIGIRDVVKGFLKYTENMFDCF